ncbi:Pyruvate/Phosphoenolpyruvate kinase [Penicillium paradoxum]|uniref:Pyruvate/Phosphoenolpyruvate kinase n=1 Tax=Penicillium paradoxum TaxID=176176 RepID=UPI002549505E|nr:Pyruvate/Phosphoenolpyruvate kinase [Penicillium paradoxum]KAJ5772961.1 Pyruvate/Phosphoenolpyruvate kinase [Penicillium paradoxum]
MPTQNDIAKTLRTLHQPGEPLILTSVYDAATASTLAALPTAPAIVTASYAIAATIGPPSLVPRHQPKPLTVDLQDGYGDEADLSDTIKQVITLGAVGYNIEDMDAKGALRSVAEATARVAVVVRRLRPAFQTL